LPAAFERDADLGGVAEVEADLRREHDVVAEALRKGVLRRL
jgi:hypothetical protein